MARRGEQVVGFGHWELHAGKGAHEEEENEPLPLPEGTDKEKGPRIFDELHKASEGIEGPFISKDVFLDSVYVSPCSPIVEQAQR